MAIDTELKNEVAKEVLSTYTHEEIREFKNFREFWGQVETQNAYEEDWKAWKKKGIKATYSSVYYQLRSALQ